MQVCVPLNQRAITITSVTGNNLHFSDYPHSVPEVDNAIFMTGLTLLPSGEGRLPRVFTYSHYGARALASLKLSFPYFPAAYRSKWN